MAEESGEEKLIAVARHIARTLGHSDTMADDILHIFSNFDNRFRQTLTDNLTADDPHQSLKALDRQISPLLSSDAPIWSKSESAAGFLAAMDALIPLADNQAVPRAADLLHLSMFRLQEEFKTLMTVGSGKFDEQDDDDDDHDDDEEDDDLDIADIPVAHPVTDFDVIIDALPSGTIADLNSIACRMVSGRYSDECCHVYSTCRRNFLEESLSRVGLTRHLSIEEVQKMSWAEMEDEIERWTKAATLSLKILFPSERRLCDRVFLGLPASAADLAFMEVCRGATVQLLNFADAVAIGSRAPERLFKVLDVFEKIRDLIPDFESVFSDQYCVSLRNEAVSIWKRLGEAIRGIFMELENLIRRDPAKAAVPGGGLHPITRYVMNYLRAACRSQTTLEQVFEENALDSSSFSVQLGWIMELLESNLESKSKTYRDPAFCSVFMMNNVRYVVQKVRDCELGSLLGDDWVRKQGAKVRQYHVNYQRNSWNKVIGLLKLDSSVLSSNGGSRVMREKIKAFNSCFDEVIKSQSSWVIFDGQLKEELKISVVGNLSPPYRSFLGRFQACADIGKHERHIKYSVEELEARVNELFRGNPSSSNGRK